MLIDILNIQLDHIKLIKGSEMIKLTFPSSVFLLSILQPKAQTITLVEIAGALHLNNKQNLCGI